MNILIHACLKRNWYVYKHLIPSLLTQGIREDEVHVWIDIANEGNLKSWVNSCRACDSFISGFIIMLLTNRNMRRESEEINMMTGSGSSLLLKNILTISGL